MADHATGVHGYYKANLLMNMPRTVRPEVVKSLVIDQNGVEWVKTLNVYYECSGNLKQFQSTSLATVQSMCSADESCAGFSFDKRASSGYMKRSLKGKCVTSLPGKHFVTNMSYRAS